MVPARLLLTALLLLAAPLRSQQEAPAAPSVPDPRTAVVPKTPRLAHGRITGRVTCNDTLQPARGAVVMLLLIPSGSPGDDAESRQSTLTARVGLDGTYTIEHVPAGDYGVIAFLPGYLTPVRRPHRLHGRPKGPGRSRL